MARATASLSGTVIDAGDRTPLSRARVVLTSPAIREPRVTISAPNGTFQFERLPPGTYTIAVTRRGYAEPLAARQPNVVTLTEGQKLSETAIGLVPAGVIAGQVLDEDDQPMPGVLVDALAVRVERGRSALESRADARTDDRGEFRLIGLAAGQYYVAALDPAFANVGDDSGALRYTPTYFPGVLSSDEATSIAVTPAGGSQKAVFRLRIVPPARVTGTIHTEDRRQLLSGAVVMNALRRDELPPVSSRDVKILPDGSFMFRNVPPGRYEIRARGDVEEQGTALFGTFKVEVLGREISNLDIVLRPGATIEGTLVVEAARTPGLASFAGLRVRAPLRDGSSFGDALTGDVRSDGSFRIRGVMTGAHAITVEGLPYPWTIKSIVSRGQEMADAGFEAGAAQRVGDVRVTITDVASEVTGSVRDASGSPAAGALVLVVPMSEQFWAVTSRRIALVRADEGGRYRVRGLPAGDYRLAASSDLDESEAHLRAVWRGVAESGLPVAIEGANASTLDLSLTPAATLRRPPAR